MRRGPAPGFLRIAPVLAGLALLHCQREAPPPPPTPAPSMALVLDPWSWHFVGGLVVITGEVEDPMEVTLKGTTLNETRTLPFGPVRWELLRPPPGEVAELRAGGKLLMKFEFDKAPPPRTRAAAPVPIPEAAPQRSGPPPAPGRPAPAPVAPPPEALPAPARPAARQEPARPVPAPAQPPASMPGAGSVRQPVRQEPARPAPFPVPPPLSASAGGAQRPQLQPPPRPQPVPVAPPQEKPSPVRSTGTLPVRPMPSQQAPPAPVAVPVLVAPAPARPVQPPPPKPRLEPPPNPKVPPRAAPAPVIVARSTSNVPATPSPSAKPAVPPPVKLPEASAWPGAGEGANVLRGPKGDRRICMTFDGGSTSEVALDVLDALKARNIRTTIFLTGDFIRKYPDLVRRIDRDGHEIGNHTLTHPHLAPGMRRDPRWTRERVQQELLEADKALFRLLGRPMDPVWRAPYGEHTAEIRKWAEELGYRHVGWSEGADTLDWATVKERKLYRTGNAILDKLRARMEKQDGDGLIVLMHLGSGRPSGDRPGQVLGPFLDRALQDGWHFVPIGDYVKGLGKPRWEPVRRVALLR